MAMEMTINGTDGYFLTEDEYAALNDAFDEGPDEEELEELRTEVNNLKYAIAEARDSAYEVIRTLDNA